MEWDGKSGIRERLALVAKLGDVNPYMWQYDSHKDQWRHVVSREVARVTQEGSESLRLIADRWQMDRKAAMAFIGYPEAD